MSPEPLREAERLQREASALGFDWSAVDQLWPKLAEEVDELKEAQQQGHARMLDELGDLLFMVVNLARHLGVDPQAALAAGNDKFRRRFGYVMQHADRLPPQGSPERLDRMEQLWVEAKRRGL